MSAGIGQHICHQIEGKDLRWQTDLLCRALWVNLSQVLHNQPLSYPADLWALGCIIFQMLVGQPPFKGASEYLTFQKVSISGAQHALGAASHGSVSA